MKLDLIKDLADRTKTDLVTSRAQKDEKPEDENDLITEEKTVTLRY